MAEYLSQKRQRVFLLLILVLGTILRIMRLGNQSFSYDEAYSVGLAGKSLGVVSTSLSE